MYQVRPPAAALAPYVEWYWFVRSTAQDPVDLQVAAYVDGRADLVFNFGAPYQREIIGGESRELSRSNLDAQRLYPIRITQRGAVEISGVRFRLGGLAPFVETPLERFTGRVVTPSEAFGPEIEAVERALRADPDIDAQKATLDAFFSDRLAPDPRRAGFERALAAASEDHGDTVEALAEAAEVTRRQLARLFARYLGIPPKTIHRIVRFQRALSMLMRDPGCTLAEVAARCGYFDQAHFIKDFRQMTGGVPRGYRGYYPPEGPDEFAPNVVLFLQDDAERAGLEEELPE